MKLIPEKDFPELQRDPASGIWYIRKEAKGKKPLFKSTREKHSKTRARSIALKLMSDWMGAPVKGRVFTFDDIGKEVIESKRTKREATQESAKNHITKRLSPRLGHFRVDQITSVTFDDYVNERRLESPKQKFFNDWKHFMMVMNRAFEKRLIPHKLKIKNPDGATEEKRVYTDEEVTTLLSLARPILRLQILMGIKMGFRPGEITQLKINRINWTEGCINLVDDDTKTKKPRSVPFHPDVIGPLKEHIEKRVKGAVLFQSPHKPNKSIGRDGNRRAWDRVVKKAGLTGGLHSLRHTCATRMAEQGVHPVMAARILGMGIKEYDRTYCKPRLDALTKAMHGFATGKKTHPGADEVIDLIATLKKEIQKLTGNETTSEPTEGPGEKS